MFLNVPYDSEFTNLYLAYIAGISAFGLIPRATLEIPGGARRLERILELIGRCDYSVHDLSRVELEMGRPPTPRFNMPFELGLTIGRKKTSGEHHTWFVCETKPRRILKSLSDLNGTDVYIHNGRVGGVFRQLANAFVRAVRQPTVPQMRSIYRDLQRALPAILHNSGSDSLFEARVFKDLSIAASRSADRRVS